MKPQKSTRISAVLVWALALCLVALSGCSSCSSRTQTGAPADAGSGHVRLGANGLWPNIDDRHVNGSPPTGYGQIAAHIARERLVVGTNTAATDVANVQGAVNAMAGGGTVYLYGAFKFNAAITLASDLAIVHHPSTVITATMGTSAGYGNSVYSFNGLFPGGNTTSTLTATATAGASTLALADASAISIGDAINVGSSVDARVSTYKVLNKVGSTLTLDRKLVKTFAMVGAVYPTGTTPPTITITGSPTALVTGVRIECTSIAGGAALTQWTGRWSVDSGGTWTAFTSAATVGPFSGLTFHISAGNAAVDNVWQSVVPVVGKASLIERVRLIGNGALITDGGVGGQGGDRAFNILPAWDSVIDGFRITGHFPKFAASFDLGGYRNEMRNLRIDARDLGAGTGSGAAIESNENSTMRGVFADNVPSTLGAIIFPSSDNCHGFDLHAKGASHSGISFTVNNPGLDTFGSRGCSVDGWTAEGSLDGVEVSNGSTDIQISNGEAAENTTGGIHLTGTTAAPVDGVQISNVRLLHNQNGLHVDGATGVLAKNIVTRDNTATQIYFINGARFEVDGWRSVSTNISSHMTNPAGTGTCEAHLRGFHWSSSGAAGGQDGFIWQGVADVWMSQGRAEWLGAGAGVALIDSLDAVAGNLYIDNVKMIAGKGAAYGLYLGSSRVGYIGEGVDMSACTNPTVGGSGKRYGVAFTYAGSPENNVLADKGSMCRDTTNGAVYIKTTDAATTGWKLVTHAGILPLALLALLRRVRRKRSANDNEHDRLLLVA